MSQPSNNNTNRTVTTQVNVRNVQQLRLGMGNIRRPVYGPPSVWGPVPVYNAKGKRVFW